jgi:hypothetical protein
MANGISFDVLAIDKASDALSKVGREVSQLGEKVSKASGDINVDADTSKAREKLAAVDAQLARLNAKSFKVDADTAAAERQLAILQAELKKTTDEDRQARINLDISTVQAKLRALAAEKVAIDVETGAASAKIKAIESDLRRVDGQKATAKVDVDAAGALSNLARIVAAVAAIPTVVTIAVGAVGALSGAGAALGLGMGAGIAGTQGLGDAVKALGEKSTASGGAATVSASAIRAANQGIVDAKRDLIRANEDVGDAEKAVTRAQEDAQRAQDALAGARRDAARELEDYSLRAAGMALSEESATLGVAEAQDRLRRVNEDSKSTSLERARAELTVREAMQRVSELSVEAKRLTEDKTEADAKGVEGSDKVVSAQDRIRDANEKVADAQRNLARAQEGVTRATEKVAEAMTRLQEASKPQGGGGGGGVDKLAEAMDNLGPKGQKFARYLRDLVDGPLKDLRIAGQEAFLPGVQSGLERMEKLLPGITPGWVAFSREVGTATGNVIAMGAELGGPFLNYAAASLRGLEPLQGVLQGLERELGNTFDRLADSGEAEKAMNAVVDVLGAVTPLIPPLIEAGAEIMTALGPGLTDVLTELAKGIEDNLPGLVSMAGLLSDVLSAVAPISPEIMTTVLAFIAFRKIGGELGPIVDIGRAAFEKLTTTLRSTKVATEETAVATEAASTKMSGAMTSLTAAAGAVVVQAHALSDEGLAKFAKLAEEHGRTVLPQYRQALSQTGQAMGLVAGAADGATLALGRLTEANREETAQFMSTEQASLRFEESLSRLSQSIDTNGRSINVHTTAGQANREALLSLVSAANDNIGALERSGAPIGTVTAAYDTQRAKLVDVATQLFGTKAKAQEYIDKLLEIPAAKSTTVTANTASALTAIRNLLNAIPLSVTIGVSAATSIARAAGGWVVGPGRTGVDSVPLMAAPDEFVVNSSASAEWAPALEAINSGASPTSVLASMSPLVPMQRGGGGGGATTVVNNYFSISGVVGDSSEVIRQIGAGLKQGVERGDLPRDLFTSNR